MFDLKVIGSVLDQLEEERGIPREKVLEAIETALAAAYKKEYGKRNQIIRARFDLDTGATEFFQIKFVVELSQVLMEGEEKESEEDERIRYDPEKHIFLEDALKIKKDAQIDDEIVFPLEEKSEYSRIAAQTAKQLIIQKIREAEKVSVLDEFGARQGEVVSGHVQRIERGNIFVEFERAYGILPYDEQIPGERFRQGERIRAYLYAVEESSRGVFLRLSRSHPKFLTKLFETEAPELASGTVEIKAIAREPGSRSKIAVLTHDEHIDPVGSLVGQRGVRVSTVMSQLGGEKIDVIEWSEDPKQFIEGALSPARVIDIEIDEDEHRARVEVSEEQQSLAIGKGGQNVRLAAKLTGWKIDIRSLGGENIAAADETGAAVEAATAENAPSADNDQASEEDIDTKEFAEATRDDTPPPSDKELGGGPDTEVRNEIEERRHNLPEAAEEENAKEGEHPHSGEEKSARTIDDALGAAGVEAEPKKES